VARVHPEAQKNKTRFNLTTTKITTIPSAISFLPNDIFIYKLFLTKIVDHIIGSQDFIVDYLLFLLFAASRYISKGY